MLSVIVSRDLNRATALELLQSTVDLCVAAGASPREIGIIAREAGGHDQRAFERQVDVAAAARILADLKAQINLMSVR